MNSDQLADVLKRNNPFASGNVGDPWDNSSPDVPAIYSAEFEQITNLIQQKRSNPKESYACLITGEAGAGKTHLTTRILNYCKTISSCSFAYIQPIENPRYPFNYLVREIFTNLCRPINQQGKHSQLDRLIGSLFAKVLPVSLRMTPKAKKLLAALKEDPLKAFNSDIYNIIKDPKSRHFGIKHLNEFDVQFDNEFLEVIFAYRIKEKRYSAIKWLNNTFLNDADKRLLGKAIRGNHSEEELEAKSLRILRSLGLLFRYTKHIMVVCFDRLENLERADQVSAFGKSVEFLIDVTHCFLPIIFYRGETWEGQIKSALNQHVVTRLQTNRLDLQGCDYEQSVAIIKSRIGTVVKKQNMDGFGPLDEQEIYKRFSEEVSLPREVINEINIMLKEVLYGKKSIKKKDLNELLTTYFSNAISKIESSFDEDNLDGSKLIKALKLYVFNTNPEAGLLIDSLEYSKKNLGGLPTAGTDHKELLGEVTQGKKETYKVLFIVDDAEQFQSINKFLKRAIAFLKAYDEAKVFYIRDARSTFPPLPHWKGTHKNVDLLQKAGGCFLRLKRSEAIGWYALWELSSQVSSKELTYQDTNGQLLEINRQQLCGFISTRLHDKEYPWFYQIDQLLKKDRCDLKTKPQRPIDKALPIQGTQKSEKVDSPAKSNAQKKTSEITSNHPQAVQLINALSTQGLSAEVIEMVESYRFTRFKIKPNLARGTTVRKIKNQSENLQIELELDSKPLIQTQAGYISIDIPQKRFKPLFLEDVLKTKKPKKNDPMLTFPLGMSIDNEPFWADFSDPNMSSILVGGTSGSGKSVFLKAVVLGLAGRYPKNALQVLLIDPKRVSFADLSNIPHLAEPIIMENKKALKALKHLVALMEERYKLLEKAEVIDIAEYNQKNEMLPRFVIVIDEYADLMMGKEANRELEQAIQRIGQKGRAAGVHLILSTQRPDSKVITPLIKANLQLKIALKVTSVKNSMIILDEPGAECLLGKGDLLVGGSFSIQRLQGPMVGKVRLK